MYQGFCLGMFLVNSLLSNAKYTIVRNERRIYILAMLLLLIMMVMMIIMVIVVMIMMMAIMVIKIMLKES